MEVDGGMYLAEEEGKGVDVTAGMLPPIKNHLSSFSLQEITTPLTLHQQEQLANTLLSKIQEREDILQSKYTLPDHLEEFRKIFDPPSKLNVRLPIISQLSPRTKSKLSVLPKPNDYELQETRKVEKQIKQLGGKRIYDEITKKYPSTTAVDTTTSPLILLDNVAKGSPEMKKPDHPNSVGNFLIPKYAKTENIVDKKSSEYFEVIERNKKRRAEQELKMAELFGGPSTASQSTTQQAVEEKKSSHGERSHTAGNNTGPLHDVSTPQTSSLQSKTITMLASPFALLAAHQTNNNGSSKGQSKKKSKTKSSVTSSMSALPVPTSSSFYAPPAGGRMLPNPLLVKKHEEVEYLNNFSAKVYDEIGLDLNHAYNRNRKFKQSIQVLMFYWYRCALHTSWIQWKTWIQYLRKKAQNNAVKKITNMFRKLLYYKQKSAKQKYKSLQQDAERKRFMDNQRYLARNAKRIARFIRWIGKMKRIRKLLKFRRAVTKIQKVFRGWKARLFVRIKRRVFMNLVHNVTIVQCIFRLRYAKRRVSLAFSFSPSSLQLN